jgi:hypothetical protein
MNLQRLTPQHAAAQRAGYVCRGPFGNCTDDPISVFMSKPLE